MELEKLFFNAFELERFCMENNFRFIIPYPDSISCKALNRERFLVPPATVGKSGENFFLQNNVLRHLFDRLFDVQNNEALDQRKRPASAYGKAIVLSLIDSSDIYPRMESI